MTTNFQHLLIWGPIPSDRLPGQINIGDRKKGLSQVKFSGQTAGRMSYLYQYHEREEVVRRSIQFFPDLLEDPGATSRAFRDFGTGFHEAWKSVIASLDEEGPGEPPSPIGWHRWSQSGDGQTLVSAIKRLWKIGWFSHGSFVVACGAASVGLVLGETRGKLYADASPRVLHHHEDPEVLISWLQGRGWTETQAEQRRLSFPLQGRVDDVVPQVRDWARLLFHSFYGMEDPIIRFYAPSGPP